MRHSRPCRTIMTFCTLLAFCLLPGCGGGDAPELGTVTGTVTLDGKPLPDADIVFSPEADGTFSVATTDDSGHYELRYSFDEMGAIPGRHKVRISTGDLSGDQPVPEKLPAKYNHLSELVEQVEPGENEINFDLTSEGTILQPNETEKIEMLKYQTGQ